MHSENALSVQDLSAGYPGEQNVIENVSFAVEPGERVGVLGPNGAGKSTLFKAIIGELPVRSGEIAIHGVSVQNSDVTAGYVPQFESVDLRFPATVREVVMMGRTRQIGLFRRASRADWQLVDDLIELVGMTRFRGRQIGQLSGGQRRRVFIARALAQSTDVLLLDEPFSGVDATAEGEIMRVLDTLQHEGVTVLMATHDMHMAQSHFDHLLMLNHRVIAYGQPDNLFVPDVLRDTFGGQIGIFETGGQQFMVMQDTCA